LKDQNKHIDDLIRNDFQSDASEFNPDSWNSLKDKLNTISPIDQITKEAFVVDSELPPESVWNNVNDELDIDTVWIRLDAALTKKRIFFYRFFSIAAFLILGIIPFFFFDGDDKVKVVCNDLQEEGEYKVEHNNLVSNRESLTSDTDIHPSIIDNTKNSNLIVVEKRSRRFTNAVNGISKSQTTAPNINSSNGEETSISVMENGASVNALNGEKENSDLLYRSSPVREMNLLTIFKPNSLIDGKLIAPDSSLLALKEKNENSWMIGVTGVIDQTKIMDAQTREGYRRNSLVLNMNSASPGLGFFVRKNLKNNLNVEWESFIWSTQKNRNSLYESGEFILKETSIDYWKNAFMVNKKMDLNKMNPENSFLLGVGLYHSILKGKIVKYDGVITSLNQDVLNTDFGFKSNLLYQKESVRFYFAAGVHADFGLMNIFEGNNILPRYLNTTRNISVGGIVKIGYKFKK